MAHKGSDRSAECTQKASSLETPSGNLVVWPIAMSLLISAGGFRPMLHIGGFGALFVGSPSPGCYDTTMPWCSVTEY